MDAAEALFQTPDPPAVEKAKMQVTVGTSMVSSCLSKDKNVASYIASKLYSRPMSGPQ